MKHVRIRDRETGATRTIELGAWTKPGWNKLVLGWSIGGPNSGADIVVAEPLPGAELGVYPTGHHVIV